MVIGVLNAKAPPRERKKTAEPNILILVNQIWDIMGCKTIKRDKEGSESLKIGDR
jgi:hypothetical protein